MASFAIATIGTTLNAVTTSGTVTALTLPTNVTIVTGRRPRFAMLGTNVFLVNAPTRNLWIDRDQVVRPMSIQPPPMAPVLTAVAGGTLSGTFKVKCTFLVRDLVSNQVLLESPFGPASEASSTLSTKWLKANGIPISKDAEVNGRRLYRTATGPGTVYYPWIDVDGNSQTAIQDDLADASLSLAAAPTTLGNPPGTLGSRMLLISNWRGRLWGVDGDAPDEVVYTEAESFSQWSNNRLVIPTKGYDARGVTGFAPRKEALGIGKINALFQVTGTSGSNFRVVKVTENTGIEAPESVTVYRDIALFLWKDGVYQWDSEGIKCVSDGKVRNWFTTSDYFNPAQFLNAFASFDAPNGKYRLHLAAAGSSNIDRWVEYDLNDETWWGPHLTSAMTPTCAATLYDANDQLIPVIGESTGFLFKDQNTRTDSASTAISSDADSKFHDMQTPDISKYFGELALISKIQSAGTLTITPYVGGLGASAGTAISADMTLGRERLRRLGDGTHVKLNFTHATAAQDVEIFGYEIPFFENGRR